MITTFSVAGFLNEYIKEKQNNRLKRERSGKWNPSSFGRCFRYQFWNRADIQPSNPMDNRDFLVFEVGNIFHKYFQDLMKNKCQIEVLVEEDDVKGYADIVTDEEVIELKSQHSKAFWYMQKEGYDIQKQKFHNCLQVAYYSLRLNKNISRLCFVSKDDLCLAEYPFGVFPYWKDRVEEELSTLREYWSTQTLPPASPRCYKDKDGKSKECSYCNFKTLCEGVEDGNNTDSTKDAGINGTVESIKTVS